MQTSSAAVTLARAFATLRTTDAGPARDLAIAEVYLAAHPLLARRCAPMLRRTGVEHHLTPEDLASAALVACVIVGDPRKCTESTPLGILRYFTTVARRRLLDDADTGVDAVSASRARRLDVMTRTVEALLPTAHTAAADDRWSADWIAVYTVALATVPAPLAAIWRASVEQQTPDAIVAVQFGVDRTTVWRAKHRVAALLAPQLVAFTTGRRVLSNFPVIAPRVRPQGPTAPDDVMPARRPAR